MTRRPRPWTLPAPRTAQNAARRALENARAFSTSVHRPSCRRDIRTEGIGALACAPPPM